MHFSQFDEVYERLRRIINLNVDDIVIMSFIQHYPKTALLLARASEVCHIMLLELNDEELKFLESIDGDSNFIMHWENHPVRGITCEVSAPNI